MSRKTVRVGTIEDNTVYRKIGHNIDKYIVYKVCTYIGQ